MARHYLLFFCLFAMVTPPVFACTAFLFKSDEEKFLAKSYDWHIDHGFLLTNKRGVKKTSFVLYPGQKSINWISRFGSLTFNQYGREFPNGGMNEAGVAVEILASPSSVQEPSGEKPSLVDGQWVQYQLDTAGSVQEMMENARKVDPAPTLINGHFIACDTTGSCAVFEFFDRKLHIRKTLRKLSGLTNSKYEDSIRYAKKFKAFGGSQKLPLGSSSLDRFVRANILSERGRQSSNPVAEIFNILDSVNLGDYSVWNLSYNLSSRQIYFLRRSDRSHKLQLAMDQIDFSCKSPVLSINLEGETYTNLEKFTLEENRRLIKRSIGRALPAHIIERGARYPETLTCQY